jgi:tryptophanyl-tRNA synthetase
MSELIFSGVQPTGNLHLGNYLGAIKQWVKVQNNRRSIFCVVDLHAITVHQDPEDLKQNSLSLIAAYIACGIDPEKSSIFLQSTISEHAELAWILSCNTPLGWLNRMTQFKEKAGKKRDNAVLGLYSYPVLMAADILLYNATHVPVGDDQKQHLELTREIANSFNHKYGEEVFTIPEPLIMSQAKRVMSLRDGSKKMSKSDASDYSRVNMTDSAEEISLKFKKAKTDMVEGIYSDLEKRPETTNLINIYSALADISVEEVESRYKNEGFAKFKSDLADLAVEKLGKINDNYVRLLDDKAYLSSLMKKGREEAKQIASENIKRVKETIGLYNLG